MLDRCIWIHADAYKGIWKHTNAFEFTAMHIGCVWEPSAEGLAEGNLL